MEMKGHEVRWGEIWDDVEEMEEMEEMDERILMF